MLVYRKFLRTTKWIIPKGTSNVVNNFFSSRIYQKEILIKLVVID